MPGVSVYGNSSRSAEGSALIQLTAYYTGIRKKGKSRLDAHIRRQQNRTRITTALYGQEHPEAC